MSIGIALSFSSSVFAQTAPRQFLRGHLPPAVSGLPPVGRLAASTRLNLAIGLPLRNRAGLDELLKQIYDPASPKFRHYLTPEQFTEQFGATESDYQAVIAFFEKNGFTVTVTHPNRLLLDVSGPAADVEKVFHVTMRTYRHPTEARLFFSPDVEPSVDLAIPILHVSGLNNYSLPKPANLKRVLPAQNAAPHSGSGPKGFYMGGDFRAAYAPGVSLDGSGQSVALLQFDGYFANDITTYESEAGLPNVSLTNILIDGFSGSAGGNSDEVSLDIEMAVSMAPGLSNVIVYEEANGDNPDTMLTQIATDDLAGQISCSWTWGGGDDPTADTAFLQMAAQGQSFFNASGDSDAYTGSISLDGAPADNPYITIVGGTFLNTTGPGGSLVSESVWNRGGDIGSSGGVSATYPIPTWQQGVSMDANQGSITMRNIPDVALIAENVWVIYGGGQTGAFGGTSCASPLWAGFMALVNQQAAANGQPPVGFVNPAIYAIGKGPNYASDFNDVTSGNNFNGSSPGKFSATSGYDLCTGWGSPNGMNLITALATPDALGILPADGFDAAGPPAGPFNVTSEIFFLTNSGETSLNWSLLGVPPWLDVSTNSGALMPGSSDIVTVSLNATTVSNLPPANYAADLIFSNSNTGIGQDRTVALQIGQSIVQNGGFESGDFSLWTLVGTGPEINFVDNGPPITPHSGTYAAALGQVGAMATLSQTLPTLPGQRYLISFWLSNPGSARQTEQFMVNWNAGKIFGITNPPIFNWTNKLFIVTAAATNSTLQFSARNDPNYFGLDDISVTPVSSPKLTAQPADLTVFPGSNAVFSAMANGSPSLIYHWRRNGTNLVNTGNISGATTNVLMITAATTDNSGNYDLVVTNAYGSITSSVAALTIALPPAIAGSMTNQTVECGGSVTFTINPSGTPPFNYQWSLNYAVINGKTNNSFSLSGVHPPGYTIGISVTNLYGGVSSNAVLTVNDTTAPAITLNGDNPIYIELGGTFTDPGATASDVCAGPVSVSTSGIVNVNTVGTNILTYTADDGNGNTNIATRDVIVRDTTPPAILWSFTNMVLAADTNCSANMPDVTGTNYILATDLSGTLIISQAPTNDFILALGTNTIVITVADASGNAAYSTNTIVILDQTPPQILSQPQSQTNFVGTTANFSVAATACPPLAYQWFFNDDILTGQTNCALPVVFVNVTNAGNYSVVATASGGSTTSIVATLTVNLIPPGIAPNPAINPDGSFILNLTGSPGYAYILETTTNLSPPGWQPVATNTLDTNGVWQFNDTEATNFLQRFYRLKFDQ